MKTNKLKLFGCLSIENSHWNLFGVLLQSFNVVDDNALGLDKISAFVQIPLELKLQESDTRPT